MDMKKVCKIHECGDLQDLSRYHIVVGYKQLRKALQKGEARIVFLAENADPAMTAPIAQLCGQKNIRLVWVRSMQDLGRACGIDVGAAAAAAVD